MKQVRGKACQTASMLAAVHVLSFWLAIGSSICSSAVLLLLQQVADIRPEF
jgi:hypothetical protein